MENNNFILKVSRLFPSSCNARTLPDVAKRSITIYPKTNKNSHDQNDLFSFVRKPEIKNLKKNPTKSKRYQVLCNNSDIEGRKCPPVTPISNLNYPKKKFQECNKSTTTFSAINQSSSSISWCTWFSSSDEKSRPDSLSSLSADSFRRRFKICEELKSIDEIQPENYNKSAVTNKIKIDQFSNNCQDYELGYDHILTQIYYSKGSRRDLKKQSSNHGRRRRKMKKSGKSTVTIEESYAVEKKTRDPQGDFRASMVEMIVEKNMFGAEDLDRLLHCFLSLNSASYHGVIVDVFSEICETLFSN